MKEKGMPARYAEFNAIEDCAKSAARVFAKNGWTWSGIGVPDEQDILRTLREMRHESQEDNNIRIETGRLVVAGNKCGHQVTDIDQQVNAIAAVLAKASGDSVSADENKDEVCRRTTLSIEVPKVVWVLIVSSPKLSAPLLKVFSTVEDATECEIRDRRVYDWGSDVSTCIERHEIL